MPDSLVGFTLVVHDYDEAIQYFSTALQFTLIEDTRISAEKRWVRMAPPGGNSGWVLLAKASNPEQELRVGDQTGGRVAFFLYTKQFDEDYHHMTNHGVNFVERPREESYGKVVVFQDLYGNRWDLIEPREAVVGSS